MMPQRQAAWTEDSADRAFRPLAGLSRGSSEQACEASSLEKVQ